MANSAGSGSPGWTNADLGSAEAGLHSPTYKEKLRTSAAKLELDPDNTEAWHVLLNCVYKLQINVSRPFYDAFLKRFPTAAYQWNIYAQRELADGNLDRVKRIFQQCLLQCPYVQLWETYLSFLKQQGTPAAEMAAAYEFAIDHVGYDIGSSNIWQEYGKFLKGSAPNPSQLDQATIDKIRKIHQRAATIPFYGGDKFFGEWERFESGINPQLAKKLVADIMPTHSSTRACFRIRRQMAEKLKLNLIIAKPRKYSLEEDFASVWRKYIAFEVMPWPGLPPDLAVRRAHLAFKQALMHFYRFPDFWLAYAKFCESQGYKQDQQACLERAIVALPSSILLRFALADFLEEAGSTDRVNELYKVALQEPSITDSNRTLLWIQYMRYTKRVQGTDAARKVFMEGRKVQNIGWQLFASSARMEYEAGGDPKVAVRVYEHGLRTLINEPDFVLNYADFLQALNDDSNCRSLFERAVGALKTEENPPFESLRKIWDAFVIFEAKRGSPSTASAVSRRRSAALGPAVALLIKDKDHSAEHISPEVPLCAQAQAATGEILLFSAGYSEFGLSPLSKEESSYMARDIGHGPVRPSLHTLLQPGVLPDLDVMIEEQYCNSAHTLSRIPGVEDDPAIAALNHPAVPDVIRQFVMSLPPKESVFPPIPPVDYFINMLMDAPLPDPDAAENNHHGQPSQGKRRHDNDERQGSSRRRRNN